MVEIKAKLDGELTKDGQESTRGVSVIILNNQGGQRLDPEVFREAMKKRELEQQARALRG